MTLLFDVVRSDVALFIESDAGNFLASTDAWPDAGKEEQITDAFRVGERADWFGSTSTFERVAHGYFAADENR